ncbi:hypothetical protein MO973_33655 [Paenibacillus sp. TRM 82003]|nr:hypothetical protein [Paenibacillus sp. TRM 82003]
MLEATLREVIQKFDEVKERLIVIETKMDSFREIQNELKEIRKTAEDALQSTKAAHKRLDSYDKHLFVIWGALVAGAFKMAFDWISKGGTP